ncbi:hypothetical protein LN042_02205 [Kitasatospora sp. RB6PN24]|uniref:DUF6777 domain-containing protein n=1 Tax=Kitasatospora humi TaxID=2893891 RepID=UPI001E4841BD|nr:DUF6777 domain-containing protein [Kitasatospora humi]MCC9305930.1 hypothetical protein [Kitasatospora humi]
MAAGIGAVVVAGLAALLIERQPNQGSATAGTGAIPTTLQAATSPGRDPYTRSVALAPPPGSPGGAATVPVGTVNGDTAGLYGGTEHVADCDTGQLAGFLATHADRGKAWADTVGVEQSALPDYLRSLTGVLLRADTSVTNHGFADGLPTTFRSVLQAGSAVLVDAHGVPRVRCACGNPLTPPEAGTGAPLFDGDSWPGFRADRVVRVSPAPTAVAALVLLDPASGRLFTRPVGTTGSDDRATAPSPPPASAPGAPEPSGADAGTP